MFILQFVWQKKRFDLLAVIKEISIWELEGKGRKKTTGLCVTQQETSSKGHRLLTACTTASMWKCVCVQLWSLLLQRLCTKPVLAAKTEEVDSVAVQTESLNLFIILTMFTKMQINLKSIFSQLLGHPSTGNGNNFTLWKMLSKANTFETSSWCSVCEGNKCWQIMLFKQKGNKLYLPQYLKGHGS